GRLAQSTDANPLGVNYDVAAGSATPNLAANGGSGGTGWFLGDMNGSGTVTNADVTPFQLALNEPGAYTAYKNSRPNLNALRGDINGSGSITNADVARFQNILNSANGVPSGSGSGLGATGVPEPASVMLIGLGFVGASLIRRRGR